MMLPYPGCNGPSVMVKDNGVTLDTGEFGGSGCASVKLAWIRPVKIGLAEGDGQSGGYAAVHFRIEPPARLSLFDNLVFAMFDRKANERAKTGSRTLEKCLLKAERRPLLRHIEVAGQFSQVEHQPVSGCGDL